MVGEREKLAIALADYYHSKGRQPTRKYTGAPYITHPAQVVEILRTVNPDSDMVCAAWLHDTLEDTDLPANVICQIFGAHVHDLIQEVSDISKPEDGKRSIRKKLDHIHLSRASAAGQTIKLADLIDNTWSISKHDPAFAQVYLPEKRDLMKVLTKGNRYLWKPAAQQLSDLGYPLEEVA